MYLMIWECKNVSKLQVISKGSRILQLVFGSLRANSERASAVALASAASLVSKIQMGPRAILSIITSDTTAAAAWSEWHKYKSM